MSIKHFKGFPLLSCGLFKSCNHPANSCSAALQFGGSRAFWSSPGILSVHHEIAVPGGLAGQLLVCSPDYSQLSHRSHLFRAVSFLFHCRSSEMLFQLTRLEELCDKIGRRLRCFLKQHFTRYMEDPLMTEWALGSDVGGVTCVLESDMMQKCYDFVCLHCKHLCLKLKVAFMLCV